MSKDDKKVYLPKEREFMEQEPSDIVACSEDGKSCTKLPDPVKDPIVSNNISNMEFDYTDDSKDDEK